MTHSPTTTADLVHKRRYPAEVQAAMDQFRRRFGGVLDDIRETLAGRVVEAGPTDAEQLATLVVSEHGDALRAELRRGGREGVTAGRRMASRRFGLAINFEQRPESAIAEVENIIGQFEDDSVNEISERVGSDLRGWLAEGVGVGEIRNRIEANGYAATLDNRHTEMHARTLVQGAAERGNHVAMAEAPGVVGEEWNYTADGRARETHVEAGGQIASVNGRFLVGGEKLLHPGDPSGAIEEIAKCRCYATPVFEDDLTTDELAQLRLGQRLNV